MTAIFGSIIRSEKDARMTFLSICGEFPTEDIQDHYITLVIILKRKAAIRSNIARFFLKVKRALSINGPRDNNRQAFHLDILNQRLY